MEREHTGSDWDQLKKIFWDMRVDLHLVILEMPQTTPLGPDFDREVREHAREAERRKKLGVVTINQHAVDAAKLTGDLAIHCQLTSDKTLGHRLVEWLFNMNTSYALRDAELRSLKRRILTTFLGEGMNASWSGNVLDAVVVHGKWN